MVEAGVTIGAHSAAHGHMAFMDRGAMEEDLVRMTSTFLIELGFVPRLFAYPYGEYSAELITMIQNAGYAAAFGQHSGAAAAGANPFTLPRFALNERYGKPDRFATIVDTLAFPVGRYHARGHADPWCRQRQSAVHWVYGRRARGLSAQVGLFCLEWR